MVSGKYFNKGVKILDDPDIGFVVREPPDKIVVFGEKNKRYDVPISKIQQVGANVLLGLYSSELQNYAISRDAPLSTSKKDPWKNDDTVVDLSSYEGKYPNTYLIKV